MWKVKNGEQSPLWCTLLVFTQAYGKCFIPPIIVHQSKQYSQDLQLNIPMNQKFHHTPSGYMDSEGWIKSMTQFYNLCSVSPVNNQTIFFSGHGSHFENCALRQINCRKIKPLVLKVGDPINNHPNDNVPNYKLKSLCNVTKDVLILKYGTTKFLPRHMNSVLVEAWDTFKVSADNIIRDRFAKINLPPLTPPYLTKNTQACAAFIQVSFGSKV